MKKLQKLFYNKGQIIFSSLAIIGVAATMISSIIATHTAEKKFSNDMTVKEKIKEIIPIYIFPASIAFATIGCILGSCAIGRKHELAITNSYIVLSETYRAYKEKVKELNGERANSNAIAKIVSDNKYNIIELEPRDYSFLKNEEDILFFDEFSGRFFETKPSIVLQAERDFVLYVQQTGIANINDFYSFLGLPPIPGDGYLDYNPDDISWINFFHDEKEVSNDGLKCIIISFYFCE